jgi:hypothetical protein
MDRAGLPSGLDEGLCLKFIVDLTSLRDLCMVGPNFVGDADGVMETVVVVVVVTTGGEASLIDGC